MIKNVLFCSIFFVEVKRCFNFARKVCKYNRDYLNFTTIEQNIIIKYYNRTLNLNFEKTLIEL